MLIMLFHGGWEIPGEGVAEKPLFLCCEVLVCSFLLVMLSAALCSGQVTEIESVIPAYSVAYVAVRDVPGVWDAVKASSSWQSFLLSDDLAGEIQDIKAVMNHLKELLGVDLRTLAQVFGHRIAFVQIYVDAGGMGPPAIVADLGLPSAEEGDPEDVTDVVWKVEQALSRDEEYEVRPRARTYRTVPFGLVRRRGSNSTVRYAFLDNLFVLALGKDTFEAILDVYLGEDPSLLYDPGFNATRDGVSADGEVFAYVNLELIRPIAWSMCDSDLRAILQILGAHEVRAVAWTMNLLGSARDQQLYMYMGESRGLMSSLFANPEPLLAPHLIPAVDTDMFLAAHLGNPEAVWEKIRDAVRSVMGDENYSYMQKEISEFEDDTALSLKDDILSSLTGEVGFAGPVTAIMRFAEGPGYLLEDGLIVFCGVEDRGKCAMSIERIFSVAGVQLQQTEYRGVAIYYILSLSNSTVPLGYIFAGDLLIFGNLQKLELIINEEPPLMVSEKFARVNSQLPQRPGLLYYMDMGKAGEMLLSAPAQYWGKAGGVRPPLEAGRETQPEEDMLRLQTLGSIGWALVHDGNGLKAKSVGTSGKCWLETMGDLAALLIRASL